MRRRDVPLIAVLIATLAGAGCGHNMGMTKDPSGKVEKVAPEYDFHDSRATRARLERERKLATAMTAIRARNFDQAEPLVREIVRDDPKQADGYTMLAVIADGRGEVQAAGENYRKATELAPGQGNVLNNYGAWLCANGYPAEALVWFDRAMADPKYGSPPSVLANSGGCALQAGQGERAARDLRRALELDPGNAYALEAMARSEYGQRRLLEARAFSERRLAAAPATASVLQLAIQIEVGLGDKAAASRYQQRLGKEFPETATAHPGAKAL
jgi:type IV pilus assembly protein PilF